MTIKQLNGLGDTVLTEVACGKIFSYVSKNEDEVKMVLKGATDMYVKPREETANFEKLFLEGYFYFKYFATFFLS